MVGGDTKKKKMYTLSLEVSYYVVFGFYLLCDFTLLTLLYRSERLNLLKHYGENEQLPRRLNDTKFNEDCCRY